MNSNNIPIGQIKTFRITGKKRNGKRFAMETSSYMHACMINLYSGSVWAVLESGKKKLLKRV